MIYMQPNTDTNLGGTNPSNEHKPSQKAVKTYVNTSVSLLEDASNKEIVLTDSSARYPSSAAIKTYIDNILIPKSISILGPQKVYPRVSNVVNYRIIPEPGYAYSYYDASVTSTSNIIITNLDVYGFDVDFRNISSTQDVTLNLSVKTSNGDVLSANFTVSAIKDIYNGVGIQHVDTRVIYTKSEWIDMGFSQSEARGVVVGNGSHDFCLYKSTNGSAICWSNNTTFKIPGVTSADNETDAKKDYNGYRNTTQIVSAAEAEVIVDAPAAQWAKSFGKNWYLPAAGELDMFYRNKSNIKECSSLIGGNLEIGKNIIYWSSTQCDKETAWDYYYRSTITTREGFDNDIKSTTSLTSYAVRALACTAV